MFADGLFVRKQTSSHAPIDDRNFRRALNISFVERSTRDNGCPEGPKIVGCDSEKISVIVLRIRQVQAFDRKSRPALGRHRWEPGAASGRDDARNLLNARKRLPKDGRPPLRIFVAKELEVHRHQVVGDKARIRAQQESKALDEQARA